MNARLLAMATGHTRRVLILAGIVFLLAAALGGPVVSLLKSESSDFQDPQAQNQQALHVIERATGQSAGFGVAALVPSAGDVRGNPGAAAKAAHVVALLSKQPGFQRAIDYPSSHLPQLVSRDGRQTVVLAAFAGRERAKDAVDHVRRALAGSGVSFGGNDVAFSEINERTSSDLQRAETFAFPILLLLSLWVFRGLIAAALPLLVGGFAIVATFLLLRLIDQFAGLSIFAVNLVTGIGLGLGIDYSLFVLSRYREELARGSDTTTAIKRTLDTAGRTVLYSSLTVAGALSCLLVFPLRFLYSMGVGGALVSLADGAVALVVLPAVLVALGPRIDSLAPRWMQRGTAGFAQPAAHGAWYRLARGVMRRPGAIALVTAVALIAISLPALRLQLAPPDARVLPNSSESRQVAETLSRDYPVNGSQAITLVVHAAAGARQKVDALARRAQATAAGQAGLVPARYYGGETWQIELNPRGEDGSAANQRLVSRLRALAPAPGLLVGGPTAWFVDQKAAVAANMAPALVILALVTCGILFLMTGSVVLPVLALLMNVLTVAVGAGLLVVIFQDGHLSSLMGFSPIGGLEESNLVLLFVVAFALSTDYGVFLFARIKEAHDHGLSTRDAVAQGLERTGRLITAAALLLCVAIGAFVMSHIFFVKQLGIGAALAVAIDATFVRALLVPALIGRLGDRTWWAPRPLRRLHARIGLHEGSPQAPQEVPA
ncbi:MAG TPA: MMPL family transporter [Solirubrobacteraceae bacterium]|nr:MMPL family transporter [Solirubrobacteraceae bacterium]